MKKFIANKIKKNTIVMGKMITLVNITINNNWNPAANTEST